MENNICRTCMSKEVKMISIFDQAKTPSISNMIMAISSIEFLPNDTLPSQMCITCFETLEITYYFKEQVIKYNTLLQKQAQRLKLLARCKRFALQEVNQKRVEEAILSNSPNESVTIVDSDDELPTENVPINVDDQPLMSIDDTHVPSFEHGEKSQNLGFSLARFGDVSEENSSNGIYSHFEETSIKSDTVQAEEHFGDKIKIIQIRSNNDAVDVEFGSEDNGSYNTSKYVQHNSNTFGEITDSPSGGPSPLQKLMRMDPRGEITSQHHRCPVCGKDCATANKLSLHMRTHTGERPYKCQHCYATFTQSGYLTRHMGNYTSRAKCHQCEECGKECCSASALKMHIKSHTGEKPYKFHHCNAKFSQIGNLNIHIRKHMGEFWGSPNQTT